PHQQVLLDAVLQQERAVDAEALQQAGDLRGDEPRRGAVGGRAAFVDQPLFVPDLEAIRLGRDLFVVGHQREDQSSRLGIAAELLAEVRQLLAAEVVEEVPGKDDVEAGVRRQRQELGEEFRAGEVALFRRRGAGGEGGIKVLDVQLAAVLGEEIDVRSYRRAEVQQGDLAPADLFEERRECQGPVEIGLDDGGSPNLLFAEAGAARGGEPGHQALAFTPAASGRTSSLWASAGRAGSRWASAVREGEMPVSLGGSMSMLPLKREPSSRTTRGAVMLPRIAPDWRRMACSRAKTLPSTSPSMVTTLPKRSACTLPFLPIVTLFCFRSTLPSTRPSMTRSSSPVR